MITTREIAERTGVPRCAKDGCLHAVESAGELCGEHGGRQVAMSASAPLPEENEERGIIMAAKKQQKPKEASSEKGAVRDALFALFDKKGVDVDEDVVMAEAKKHGKVLSHNNVVKYRSVYRKARGTSRPREVSAKPAKPAKPAAKKAAAAKPAAKPKATKKVQAIKKPAKPKKKAASKGNGAAEAAPSSTPVEELLTALE